MSDLAAARPDERPKKMAEETFENLRVQAKLQCKQRDERNRGSAFPYSYEFHAPDERRGLANLPPPSPGDVFFDIEGDPLFSPGKGLEYLWGIYLPEGDRYVAFWAHDLTEERNAFEGLVDFLVERARVYPDMHVYHYAPYETSALRRLMGLFGSREDAIDDFLRKGRFVDLYPIVRQSLWISQPSYSIKAVEKLYHMKRTAYTKKGDDSIVQFESWLVSRDDSILFDIERYNEEDCRSTHLLREWLVRLRDELNATLASPIPWHVPAPDGNSEKEAAKVPELVPVLLEGIEPPLSLEALRRRDEAERARYILAGLLQYHRREAKPEWWAYFERTERTQDFEDGDSQAIGGLQLLAEIPGEKIGKATNLTFTYSFPPQEHKLGSRPHCPKARKSAGEIVSLSDDEARLRLKVSRGIEPAQLTALIPGTPLPHQAHQSAVEAVVRAYLDGALDATYPATADMLFARPPRLTDRPRGARIQPQPLTKENVSETIAALDRSYLFVQGPPGSGKTTTGAWTIVDILAVGKTVGVMTNSHKGAHNLLCKVEETAHERGIAFVGAHKSSDSTEGSDYKSPRGLIHSVSEYEEATDAANRLISATGYTWAQRKMNVVVDYLFIDEAGQVSLADAILASTKGAQRRAARRSAAVAASLARLASRRHRALDPRAPPGRRGDRARRHGHLPRAVVPDASRRSRPSSPTTIYEGRLRSAERTDEQ